MRGASVVLGALITLTIAVGTQAAMSSDLRNASRSIEQREGALHRALDPVWFGGELAPVVVEVAPLKAPRAAARATPRHPGAANPAVTGVTVRIS
jgi:hypothetical protein